MKTALMSLVGLKEKTPIELPVFHKDLLMKIKYF